VLTQLVLCHLTRYAEQHSGVSADEANCIEHSSLYSLLGDTAICQISTAFYTRVYNDEAWFRNIFATSTQADAVRNQVEFLIEKLGGPPVYTERKGRHRLIGRHSPYDISPAAAERWLEVNTSIHSLLSELVSCHSATSSFFVCAVRMCLSHSMPLFIHFVVFCYAQHMEAALDSVADVDEACKHKLMLYFKHMAHFLVAGTAFTNCTHLIGNIIITNHYSVNLLACSSRIVLDVMASSIFDVQSS
jgi:truncated hemoglobin YjbI